jgi:AcrR family transcriptional regulator
VTDPRSARGADGRRERWNDHRARRRAVLVEAGVRAIDAYGPECSGEEIAATARVSRTVLYRYFRDKDDLCSAISCRIGEIVIAELLEPLQSGTTPNEIIGGSLEALTRWVQAHPSHYYFLRQHGPSGEAAPGNAEAPIADQLAELQLGFMARLGLRPEQAEPVSQSLLGMVEQTIAWWITDRKISRRELVQHLRLATWDVVAGELHRSNIQLRPDDPLPTQAAGQPAGAVRTDRPGGGSR